MSILATILGRSNKDPIAVPTPEWPAVDGQLLICRLTPAERTGFYALAAQEKPAAGTEFLALMAAYCTVQSVETHSGGDGEKCREYRRAFDDSDWRALAVDPGSGSAIERLAEAADQANVLSDGAREGIKKKYEKTDACGNTSASPEASDSR